MASVDWKKLIAPVTRVSNASTAIQMTPAQRLAATMDNALAAFKRGNKDHNGEALKRATITQSGDNVFFSVRYANAPLLLDGENKEFSVPASKFEAVYAAIREDALKGAFDEQLEPLAARVRARGAKASEARAAKKK
jgi:hypothetical protein